MPWDRQGDRIAQKRIQKTYITIDMIIVVKRQSNISLRKHKYVYERKESTNSLKKMKHQRLRCARPGLRLAAMPP